MEKGDHFNKAFFFNYTQKKKRGSQVKTLLLGNGKLSIFSIRIGNFGPKILRQANIDTSVTRESNKDTNWFV